MLHAVIMAGGAGTRFWPESRQQMPKQLLQLVGTRTMIQTTVDRLGGLVPADRLLIVTAARLADAIAAQLPNLPRTQILGEPCKRDTAPCIGLAALEISGRDPDAIMAVLPSDQVIQPAENFRAALEYAAELVATAPQRIVTFGIKPTYPAVSFGYIERGQPLKAAPNAKTLPAADGLRAFKVERFREKPQADAAKEYFSSGNFYWNAGIFIWHTQTILAALERYQPEMYARLKTIDAARGTSQYAAVLEREFAAIRGISIDYAVMESAEEVVVVEAPFAWDDVGSWQAIARLNPADADGNVIQGRHLGVDTTGTIVRTDDEHLVATLGLRDCIVVHTPQATLVANRNDEESIRRLVKLIEERGWQKYL